MNEKLLGVNVRLDVGNVILYFCFYALSFSLYAIIDLLAEKDKTRTPAEIQLNSI